MRGRKGAVARRVPILGQHDMVEPLGKPIDDGDHGIALGNRQRTGRAEIILHIDDQQEIVGLNQHVCVHQNCLQNLAEDGRLGSTQR